MTRTTHTVVHQTLHGYADGHRLLKSSIQLTKSADRELSILSDLSGSTGGEIFDSYLTGYPLPSTNYYALSRTWPAPEMSRPGCVWTHTLLLNRHDLPEIAGVTQLFRRPHKWDSMSSYTTPILPEIRSCPVMTLPKRSYLAGIIGAVYAEVPEPIAFVIDNSEGLEGGVLALWSQQWPSLAENFKFCTGAINPRLVNGQLFDLQFIPRYFYRSARWQDTSIDVKKQVDLIDRPRWIDVAIDDIATQLSASQLRRFLMSVCGDLESERSVFRKLMIIYDITKTITHADGSVRDVAKVVDQEFPQQLQARHLKRVLFGAPAIRRQSLLAGSTEAEILDALLGFESFDLQELEIMERARKGWVGGHLDWGLVRNASIVGISSPIARDILAGVARVIGVDEIRRATQIQGLVETLVELHPPLLAIPETWRGTPDQQWRLCDIMVRHAPDGVVIEDVVRAIWESQSDMVAPEILARGGRTAVAALLDLMNRNVRAETWRRRPLTTEWLESVQAYPMAVVEWVTGTSDLTPTSVGLLAKVLDPQHPDVASIDSTILVRALGNRNDLEWTRDKRVATFVLVLGLSKEDAGGDELICRSFDSVHQAIVDREMPRECQDILRSWLKQTPPWKLGDKLRITIVKRCIDRNWSAANFSRLADQRGRFKLLVRTARKVNGGKRYLKNLSIDAISRRYGSSK